MRKTIGILGGMGPEATAYFYGLIIKNTKAVNDQEHIKVIIYANPEVPPRTDAILEGGESPLPYLVEGVRILKGNGADFIVMPCVTAHFWLPEILAQERVSFLSLLDEAVLYAQRKIPGLNKAGLISSTGTLKSRLFHEAFEKEGIEVIGPEDEQQELVTEAIFGENGIKAGFTSGRPKGIIHDTARKLMEKGAEAVIAGCTEVPLVLKDKDTPVPLIEPLQILAEVSIKMAGYELRDREGG
ncbi:MAG: amino acid racemase [Candidatus Aminicenantes bacterium]|nr:MAG: amino acid racemase [Candidatus Aminicenantes bacterium]